MDSALAHYGVGHLNGGHSGRYPWGSGEKPFQDDPSQMSTAERKKAFTNDNLIGSITRSRGQKLNSAGKRAYEFDNAVENFRKVSRAVERFNSKHPREAFYDSSSYREARDAWLDQQDEKTKKAWADWNAWLDDVSSQTGMIYYNDLYDQVENEAWNRDYRDIMKYGHPIEHSDSQNAVYSGVLECYDYLAHYGKGHLSGGHSGRYPWGSGERPMQSEGGPSAAGLAAAMAKRAGSSAIGSVKKVGGRVLELGKTNARKAVPVVGKVKKDEPQETKEQIKKRLLERGNAREMLNNADLFTTQELNEYLNRQRVIAGIQGMVPKGKNFRTRMNDFSSTINTMVGVYDAGKKVWDRARPALEKSGIVEKKKEQESLGQELAKQYLDVLNESFKNTGALTAQTFSDRQKELGDMQAYIAKIIAIENAARGNTGNRKNN